MRTLLLAGFVCLAAAGPALAESPPVVVADPVPCAAPAGAAAVMDTRPFPMTGPRFWVSGDYLLMWYTPLRTPPLIQAVPSELVGSTAPDSATTIFPENNRINFGAFNGVRLTAGVTWDRIGFEASGFVLDRKTESASVFNSGVPFAVAQGYISAGANAPTTLFASLPGEYSGGVSATAESRLWGAEANVRRAWYSFFSDNNDLLFGFRYLNLEESLVINSPSFFPNGDSITVQDSIRTRNAFYGGQIGFNGRFGGFERGFGLDFTAKSAVGGVAQRAELIGSNTFVTAGVADVEAGGLYARGNNFGTFTRGRIAYLGDLDLRLTYNFNRWVQVSFGYSLIYLSSVMRPGNAIDPVVNDANIRFVADPTPSDLARPAFSWRAEELVVQGMTFGVRVQY